MDGPPLPRPMRGIIARPLIWAVSGVLIWLLVPPLKEAVPELRGGFLPDDADSVIAGRQFAEQFDQTERSAAAVVIRRRGGLTEADERFLDRLTDALLERMATRASRPFGQDWPSGLRSPAMNTKHPGGDPFLRNKLVSRDGQAAVVQVQMPFEMISVHTVPAVDELESLVSGLEPPEGMEWYLTGASSLGRDYIRASQGGMERTLKYTVAGVVLVLLLVYRSPAAVVAALAVVSTAVFLSFRTASLMAMIKLPVSQMAEQFMVVLLYGAGTDFCLFLFARYREELQRFEQAHGPADRTRLAQIMAEALARTSPAILASAATVVIAMGTMVFARFEAYRTAGPALAGGLAVVTAACLTLAPALMVLPGKALFWPGGGGSRGGFTGFWEKLSVLPTRFPVGSIAVVLAMFVPFWATSAQTPRVFDTLQELPADAQSARGAAAFREHFASGEAYPISLLVRSPVPVLPEGAKAPPAEIGRTVDRIAAEIAALPAVHDVRTLYRPYGAGAGPEVPAGTGAAARLMRDRIAAQAAPFYIGKDRRSLRFDVILNVGAYNNESLDTVVRLPALVAAATAGTPLAGAQVHTIGATPTMQDIRAVTGEDLIRVAVMVGVSLLLILLWLLGDLLLSLVLLGATAAGYFATLGLTAVVWQATVGGNGLDWKIDFFLFCILAAVGQDYNIFIVSRIMEEAGKTAPTDGAPEAAAARRAVGKTGGIISCCGVVMAVTFGSMMAAPLLVMRQVGFALAAGVLIDTFLLRPLLVPAAYVLLERLKRRVRGGTRAVSTAPVPAIGEGPSERPARPG